MLPTNCSYEEYLKLMRQPDGQLHQKGKEIIEHFKSEHLTYAPFAPVVYLLDYTRNQYLYVDDACFNLFGFTPKQWMASGIEGYLKRWHPADFKIMNSKVFPKNIHFLQTVPPEQYGSLIFSFNYRALNAKGEYITILQRSSYIPGATAGKPLGSIGIAVDITHFKSDISVVHTIEQVKQVEGKKVTELLYKNGYAAEDTTRVTISKRELEILKWMAEGFNSRQIAQTLNISTNTVNNHRKNMLHRCGCSTSTELLSYAIKYGYLQG